MKAILISTRPEWVIKIITGIKKDEIRKGSSLYKAINKLIAEQGVAPMLLYCTKEKNKSDVILHYPNADIRQIFYKLNGKVVARFNATVDLLELRMIEGGLYFTRAEYECENCFDPKLNDFHENAQMDNWELLHYTGYELGTQISDIHINDLEIFDEPKEISEFKQCKCFTCKEKIKACPLCFPKKPLTRAPQSWCYVEL